MPGRAQAAFAQSPRAGWPFSPEQAVDINRHFAKVTGSESLNRTIYAEYQVCRTAHAEQRAQTNPEPQHQLAPAFVGEEICGVGDRRQKGRRGESAVNHCVRARQGREDRDDTASPRESEEVTPGVAVQSDQVIRSGPGREPRAGSLKRREVVSRFVRGNGRWDKAGFGGEEASRKALKINCLEGTDAG